MPRSDIVRARRVIVIGAGVGGLVAALALATEGLDVIVVEKADAPGGKMREVEIAGRRIDAGPTVFTMRWVFEEIFAAAGTSLSAHVRLEPAQVLARHAWSDGERLDLFRDAERSAEAVGAFAGPAEAKGYRDFMERARATYDTLETSFIRAAEPSPFSLARDAGLRGLAGLWRISPFTTLWRALGDHFRDPRLRQLFGRYATYCGSSPFEAPATLMLVAHVERKGVWLIDGGMHRLAAALANLAASKGATVRYNAAAKSILTQGGGASGVTLETGERLDADAVICNADASALARGLLGPEVASAAPASRTARSLSAVTWSLLAETEGFPFARHTVFFSRDYAAEFDDIFRRVRLPEAPTVYVCAQDRADGGARTEDGPERLLVLVNAPPAGDRDRFGKAEVDRCAEQTFACLARCGLRVRRQPGATVVTTPRDFERMFPGGGGALYGQASHGWTASFSRPLARTRIPGLYLAGGSTHPGPGVPMAALSGRLAAARVLADLTSPSPSRKTAMRGGMSTP